MVAAVLVGDLGPAGLHAAGAGLPRQFLYAHLAVAVHEDEEGPLLVVLEDERLDDGVLGHAQLPRADGRAALVFITVEMLRVGHARGLQQARRVRGRGLAHRTQLSPWARMQKTSPARPASTRAVSRRWSGASMP